MTWFSLFFNITGCLLTLDLLSHTFSLQNPQQVCCGLLFFVCFDAGIDWSMGLSVAEASLQLGVTSPQVKRPNPEIFDVVRKICPKEDIAKASRSQ